MAGFNRLFDVDNVSDSITVATRFEKLVPSPLNFVRLDNLAVWPDLMLCAKVEDFLGIFDSADN